MWRRVAKYAFVTLFSIGMCLSPSRVKAVSECTLCILEFSAGEAHNESADFVIIGNASAFSASQMCSSSTILPSTSINRGDSLSVLIAKKIMPANLQINIDAQADS